MPGANYGRDYAVFETVRVHHFIVRRTISCVFFFFSSSMFHVQFFFSLRPQGTQGRALLTKTLLTLLPCFWPVA